MDEIVVRETSQLDKKSGPRIGNVVLNYKGYDFPIHATPIVMESGEVAILTNIRASGGRSRVVLQDLLGNEIRTLLETGYEHANFTNDDEKIYIFTSNSSNPQLYTFDRKTFNQISNMPLGKSRIQSVCCDKEYIYTFDMNSGDIQTRNKDGKLITEIKKGEHDSYMYITSKGVHIAQLGELGITDEYRKQLEKRFGKEFMDLNFVFKSLAYDEKTQTTYVGSRNLVFVANPKGIKGVMYFKDKDIMGLYMDPVTQSLMISSINWPEADECAPSNKGGSLEILPTDMINERIQKSMEYLEKRMLLNKKSLLQQREDELSQLNSEAEAITQEERLMIPQNEERLTGE